MCNESFQRTPVGLRQQEGFVNLHWPGLLLPHLHHPLTSHHNLEYSETFQDSYRPGIVCKNQHFCPEIFSSVPIKGVFCYIEIGNVLYSFHLIANAICYKIKNTYHI